MAFSTSFIPEIRFGENLHLSIGADAKALSGGTRAAIVIDGFLAKSGLADAVVAQLEAAGMSAAVFSDFAGEPKIDHVRKATAAVAGADVVIGIGGGSALDIAKIAACCAASGEDAMHYALAANPLPKNPLKKIMVPTTAGTGSETSATNIFAGPEGKKLWIWGAETKADLVLLDPVLTATLPANLTAWCGLDAFVHAFEAATNRNAHAGGKFYAHQALRLLTDALETAVKEPRNMEARGKVLLGSCYAGIAIDNCGTALAHNVSHALAGLGPVHHGLATALGFEATLSWLVEANTADLDGAAKACGLSAASELPAFVTGLMDRCGIVRALPAVFAGTDPAALAAEMKAPENQPMRRSTIRDISDDDIARFCRHHHVPSEGCLIMTKSYTRDYWETALSTLKPEGRHFIDGVFVPSASGETFARPRPMDGQPGTALARGAVADIDRAVSSARAAFASGVWRHKDPNEKKKIMLKWAALIREHAEELAMLETLDVGKPVLASLNVDVRLCADGIQFYGEMIDKLYDEVAPTAPSERAIVRKVPLGVIGVITPWNYPMIIDAWKLGPAIAAGNSVVLKPAEQSSLSALRLAQLGLEAGLPAGVFNVITGYGEETGKPLALHMDVDMIAFTGSTEVGKLIMGYAAQSNVKRVALELGGKSPLVVFADADLDAAASAVAWGCFYNSGETCHASTRLLVERSVQDALIAKIEAVTKSDIALGHPFEPSAQIGALIEEAHMNKVLSMIDAGEKEGARRAFGAERTLSETGGYYISPGVFIDMTNDMSLARQEIFGPVLAAIAFDTEEEALSIANDTIYGLAGAVFTKDMDRAHRFSESLHAGTVWINTYDMANFSTPFGGFKQSGFGRDRSVHAIDKYCDYKTIWQHFG